MYSFQPRIPVDHVLKAVRLIRTGEAGGGELLKLLGASFGEIGALISSGPIFSLKSVDLTVEEAILKLEELENSAQSEQDPNFDPGVWIPIILLVLEWLAKRRQG